MAILRGEQLADHLQGPLAPLYLLHGSAPLLVEEAGDAIRGAARAQGILEREVLVVAHGFRWERLNATASNLSLFGERKLIDLRIPGGSPGREGADALLRLLTGLAPGGDSILISLPALDWSTRKTAWFTALSNAAVTLELDTPARDRLPAWIAARLQRQGQRVASAALDFIADRVEGNLLAAHQEIAKLGLLYPPGELDEAQVRESVLNVARYDLDSLRVALLAGEPGRCARLLEGLRGEGEAPPLVLWALAGEIRCLLRVRSALDRGQPSASVYKAERVFEPVRRQAMEQAARRLRLRQLLAALQHAARIDRIIKGLAPGEVWDEFMQLTLRLRVRG